MATETAGDTGPGPDATAANGASQQAPDLASAEGAVTALYQAHALGLIRLAHIMLGDRASAEDVVQEAFCGLYRRWSGLSNPATALPYVRASVLNGCRSVLRRRAWSLGQPEGQPAAASAEAAALTAEERREVMRAVRRLPPRQRESIVLRFYLGLSAEEIASTMGIGPGSVRSAITRGLASLHRMLRESS